MSRHLSLMRLLQIALLVLAPALSGCEKEGKSKPEKTGGAPSAGAETAPATAAAKIYSGKSLLGYAPATDFTGASAEDASRQASEMFDGAISRDAVSSGGYVPGAALTGGRGKPLPYTGAASERISDLGGVVPPLPDDYDYSKSDATPGSVREAGQTLLGFAKFQLEQKFATVAPVMSRLGWRAGPRRGPNKAHTPYRVTVHHTMGKHTMSETDTAAAVKGTQHYHMVGRGKEGKDNFSDIGYHFLVAGDGRVVEGRRAEYVGAHAGGANTGNIGIAMMGDFNKIKPTDAQIESLTRLVTFLSIKYKKDPEAKGFLEPHQHYTNTDCPGKNLLSILDALRHKIDHEKEVIMAGDLLGTSGEFKPLAVIDVPTA